jgi:hypothetical protein
VQGSIEVGRLLRNPLPQPFELHVHVECISLASDMAILRIDTSAGFSGGKQGAFLVANPQAALLSPWLAMPTFERPGWIMSSALHGMAGR